MDESRFYLIYQGYKVEWELNMRWGIMPAATKKFTPEIDAQLYDEFVAVAERNGQTRRYILEQALRFYLHNVVPSQHLVRPEVMEEFEKFAAKNHDLLQRLAR
jgi:predicted AAA+ superfamily ATPase